MCVVCVDDLFTFSYLSTLVVNKELSGKEKNVSYRDSTGKVVSLRNVFSSLLFLLFWNKRMNELFVFTHIRE